MAVEIKPIKLTSFNTITKETDTTKFTAINASTGAYFVMAKGGDKYVIGIKNAVSSEASKTITIKAGNALQGTNDISLELAKDEIAWVVLDSGKFKNVYGVNKGKVILTGSDANLQVKVIELP
jgi:uncharacterized protein YdgA (DUF945 family)